MISGHHKVVFVHIPKCAGQSIERAFLRDLNLDWEARAPLLLRAKNENEPGPERLAHLYGYEYLKFGYIEQDDFDQFYKFSVVRDPIDRLISELNYRGVRKGIFGVNSVEEYVVKARKKHAPDRDIVRHLEPQVTFLFDEELKAPLVDHVFQLKDIESEFEIIKSQIGFPNLKLEKENVSQSKEWRKSDLSNSDLDFLTDTYKKDFEFISSL